MKNIPNLPEVIEAEQTPLVKILLSALKNLVTVVNPQKEQINQLKDEINILKGEKNDLSLNLVG